MFAKVLIANRGVIVARILRTLKKLHVASVIVYSEADGEQPYIREADEAYSLGDGTSSATYLNVDLIIEIALKSGAQAIHPGYGFLSENADFIAKCEEAGITWLGPTAEQVRQFGYKHKARELAAKAGVPLIPGSDLLDSLETAKQKAQEIGYPVILKSSAGGGGIGMLVCRNQSALESSFDSVRGLSTRNFGDGSVYLEKFVAVARHIEVQIFGDGKGDVISIGERDCSTQRRNQKVLEECPAPRITEKTRKNLYDTAVRLGKLVKYRSAGTVEFIYDAETENFYFLEVNTRLQVEHGVTELVWDIDLVEWMIMLGSHNLPELSVLASKLNPRGHAIQARLYAEDPVYDFRPCAGLLSEVSLVKTDLQRGIRVDSTIETGTEVSALFDPMLAKFISYAENRNESIDGLITMLEKSKLYGIVSNKEWLIDVLKDDRFRKAEVTTQWLDSFKWSPKNACEILKPGTLTTIQDFPGRQGYWSIGVPPSGPFDDWSFQLGNQILDNDPSASGLEITISGPTIKFFERKNFIVVGAEVDISIKDAAAGTQRPVNMWQVESVNEGEILEIGSVSANHGMRAYLLVDGGFNCPEYLGSRSTFTLGQFGGHAGRQLRSGDRLLFNPAKASIRHEWYDISQSVSRIAGISGTWELRVLYGPHGAPDFFQEEDIKEFFKHEWEVHYNSSRTGIRLIGPKPHWARTDGGEAGLHPSNIHDNAYAFGTVDFTGDMPIILGPDGPSLGGFVSPAVVAKCDRWKLGQLAPGNKIKFVPVSLETARKLDDRRRHILSKIKDGSIIGDSPEPEIKLDVSSPVIKHVKAEDYEGTSVTYRRDGDDFLLVEFGKMELDISLRFRVHAWNLWLENRKIDAILDLTPGIRSLQIHYDPSILTLDDLFSHLLIAEKELRKVEELELDTREIHLPLSWDDEACQKAIDHYQKSVWPKAPWCPSNLEFIRRINGLNSIEDVKTIVFKASYLVMGLGDVYLGAPVATPLDPSHRLVTTKYNPARTWTAENSVGIGGAYLCVYGMEGPGGYQFVGRTLQMWNRYRKTEYFQQPWLLRFFDQLKFYPVSHDDLMQIRKDFPQGRFQLQVKSKKFKLADYLESLKPKEKAIEVFHNKRAKAFQEEIDMWHEKGLFTFENQEAESGGTLSSAELSSDESTIDSSLAGSIWKVLVKPGDVVKSEQTVAIIESMKMEFAVIADTDGVVTNVLTQEGSTVVSGQPLIVIKS